MKGWATILLFLALSGPALAADPYASADPERRAWFRGLSVPTANGNNMSCCGDADGIRVPLDQVKQDGEDWFVDLGDGWIKVPPQTVVRDSTSIDGEAYLFLKYDGESIRCFVRPVPGY